MTVVMNELHNVLLEISGLLVRDGLLLAPEVFSAMRFPLALLRRLISILGIAISYMGSFQEAGIVVILGVVIGRGIVFTVGVPVIVSQFHIVTLKVGKFHFFTLKGVGRGVDVVVQTNFRVVFTLAIRADMTMAPGPKKATVSVLNGNNIVGHDLAVIFQNSIDFVFVLSIKSGIKMGHGAEEDAAS